MADIATLGEPKRVIVVLRKEDTAKRGKLRARLIWVGAAMVLGLGLAFGYKMAGVLVPTPPPVTQAQGLSERVRGGLYALELATPRGQSRWMLEFDAEIVTKDGPKNPLELRNALEDLVITATSLPLVQTAENPDQAMRSAVLAVAAQDYPWLLDIYLTRSDIRASADKIGGIGRAMRGLAGE